MRFYFKRSKSAQNRVCFTWVIISGSLCVSTVSGWPVPTVSWVKDGAVLRLRAGISSQQEDNLHLLYVENVQKTDAGQYTCTATNSKGKATCSWTLAVKSKCVHLSAGEQLSSSVVLVPMWVSSTLPKKHAVRKARNCKVPLGVCLWGYRVGPTATLTRIK